MVVNLLTTNLESFAMKVLSPITSHVRALHNKMVLCHVLNRVLIRPIIEKIPYELLKGRKPNISYFVWMRDLFIQYALTIQLYSICLSDKIMLNCFCICYKLFSYYVLKNL